MVIYIYIYVYIYGLENYYTYDTIEEPSGKTTMAGKGVLPLPCLVFVFLSAFVAFATLFPQKKKKRVLAFGAESISWIAHYLVKGPPQVH